MEFWTVTFPLPTANSTFSREGNFTFHHPDLAPLTYSVNVPVDLIQSFISAGTSSFPLTFAATTSTLSGELSSVSTLPVFTHQSMAN